MLQGDKLQQAAQLANLKYGAEAQPYLETVLFARWKVLPKEVYVYMLYE